MIALDYIGLGALISATCAGIVSIVVALRQPGISKQVDEVHAAVSAPNGLTIGEMIQKNEDRNVAKDAQPEATK